MSIGGSVDEGKLSISRYSRNNRIYTSELEAETVLVIIVNNDDLPSFSGELWFGL